MASVYSCPCGHQWQKLADSVTPVNGAESSCPVCGMPIGQRDEPGTVDYRSIPSTKPHFTNSPAADNGPLPTGPYVSLGNTNAEPGAPVALPEVPGYEVVELIGKGGMGLVLKGRQRMLDRLVAIKLPLPQHMQDDADRTRFLREARAAARLRHPNICPIFEVGEAGDRPFIVLGYIKGETLKAWARKRPPSARQVAEMVAVLARTVGYAHANGIIHRDLKPGNVMVEADTGQPILMDFGLAKELAEQDVQLTQSGQVMGTPAYMAPEQAAGQVHRIGPPADIYALGVLLYELLTGRLPFTGMFGEVVRKVQTEEPLPPRRLVPRLHRDLETVCLKAMAKDPAQRYASAESLADDLERFNAGEAILARREGLFRKGWRKLRRGKKVVAAFLALAALATAVVGYVVVRGTHADQLAAIERAIEVGPATSAQVASFLADREADLAAAGLGNDERERLRQQLHARLARFIDELANPQPDDEQRIGAALDQLSQANPAVAEGLRQALVNRLHHWKETQRLAAPFDGLEKWLDPSESLVEEDHLRRMAHGKPLLLLRPPCPSTARLEVRFIPSWNEVATLGLVLNWNEGVCYEFLLATPDPALLSSQAVKQMTLAELRRAKGDLQMHIIRKGGDAGPKGRVPLRTERVSIASLSEGPLILRASREVERLTFQVNNLDPIVFDDTFPLNDAQPGAFGVWWPTGAMISQLLIAEQALPPAASALQRGDELYGRQRFEEALLFFREQGRSFGAATEQGQEARVKEGLCLWALKRPEEAGGALEQVAAGLIENPARPPVSREASRRSWPAVATSQLWLLRLEQKREREAEALFATLSGHYGFNDLARIIPQPVRDRIISAYRDEAGGLNLLLDIPDRLSRLERANSVIKLLGAPNATHVLAQLALLRAYRMAGRSDQAVATVLGYLKENGGDFDYPVKLFVEEYGWLMRERGTPYPALQELNERLFAGPERRPQPNYQELWIERARLHAAMEQWEEAEKDIEEYFRNVPPDSIDTRNIAAAALIRGFLRERRGDVSSAQDAWLAGWRRIDFRSPLFGELMGGTIGFGNVVLLASLTNTWTDEDAELVLTQGVLPRVAQVGEFPTALVREALRAALPVGRALHTNRRWRECARRLAFLDISLPDYARLPAVEFALEMIHLQALPGGLSADQESLCRQLCMDFYTAAMSGKLRKSQLLLIAASWKGSSGLFGWGGVAGGLEPSLRKRLAYVLGHRYLFLNKPKEAAEFFRTATLDEPADSPLRKLAQAELDRLKDKLKP